MRIIINCGYNHSLSKIIILKNGQHATTYSPNEGVYELDAKEGDSISIKLRSLDFFSPTIYTFRYNANHNILYLKPSNIYNIWDLYTCIILPYVCLFLLALKSIFTTEIYSYFCAGIITMTALSLICLKTIDYIPYIRRNIFTHYFI